MIRSLLCFLFLGGCLYGSLFGQFITNGNATASGPNCYILTPNQTGQSGSVWNTAAIDLNQSFQFYATIFLGCSNGGADGMVFSFQSVSTSVGSTGGGMGYQGITPSLGIEFDTYQNGGNGDPTYDHIALISQGSVSHLAATNLQGPVGLSPTLANMEDCQYHDLNISWDPISDSLKVFVDCELRIAYQGNIVQDIFGGNPSVFWGFTAGTGALSNLQQFCYSYIAYGVDSTICQGDTLGLTVGSGTAYSWSPATGLDNANIATPLAFPDTTTLYTCTITDPCGFTREEYFQITVIDSVAAFDLGADTSLCPGQILPLLQEQPGATYEWQNGSTDSSFTIVNPGLYWLEIQTGCDTLRDSISMAHYLLPTVDLGPDILPCQGDTILLDATDPVAAAYLWQDGSTDSVFELTTSGLYWVELNHICGPVRDSVQADFTPELPTLDLGADTILCDLASFVLNPALTGVNYLWSDNSSQSSLSVTQTGTYWLEISNACFTNRDSITLIFEQIPLVDLGPDSTLCVGDSLFADVSWSATTLYSWQDGFDQPFRNLGDGLLYTVSLSNVCGTATDEILLGSLAPPPAFDLGPDSSLCEGDEVRLTSGLSGYEFQWQDMSTISSYTVTAGGLYSLQVSNRCGTSTASRSFQLLSMPEVELGDDVTLCTGDSVGVDVSSPGATYDWSDGSTEPVRTLREGGIYGVILTNSCGVVDDMFQIELEDTPVPFELGQDRTLCEGERVDWDIEQSGDFQYKWQDGDSNPQKTATRRGLYLAEVSNECGVETDSVYLDFVEPVKVDLGPDTLMCEDRTDRKLINAFHPQISSYRWQDGSTDPTYAAQEPGIYAVEVSNACNTLSDTLELIATACVCGIYVPSAFTPNGDAYNDEFYLVYECQIVTGVWKVFNRWGQVVFESTDPNERWDGKSGGQACSEGVYVWVLEYEYLEGDRARVRKDNGTVTLLR